MKNPTRNGILRMIARMPESKRWSETVTHIEILYKFLQKKKLISEFKEFESIEYKGELSSIETVLNNLEAKIKEEEV
ncbi:MAG: hypothetical protein EBS19_16245 [Spirochaetia bacterium]|nr:hypothetical protein [Spirochaetia bacterium]